MNLSKVTTAALAGLALVIGASSASAVTANCGSARVCALVTGAGGLSRSKNVSKITHPGTGVYCVTPKSGVISVSVVTPLTTIEWGSSGGSNLLAMYSDSKLNCPSSALEFHTFDTGGNPTNNASFFFVVN